MRYDCLIIDDEKLLADSTAEYFNLFGVRTAVVYSASGCRSFFQENGAELLLLDINLGDGSGFSLCKELREKMDVPILFISARTSDDDKLVALHIGGDDYVQKPYSLSVLLAKVKVVLRRYGQSRRWEGQYGNCGSGDVRVQCQTREGEPGDEQCRYEQYHNDRLTVDFSSRQVFVDGVGVRLTSLEFRLLSYLVRNENRLLSKQELFDNVWEDRFTGDGTLNVHIRRLREAIERDPGNPEYILTVWGEGYRFCGRK